MKWIYGLLCLFFLILFHEFGHFIAAKIFGVKVEAFSIGFGPVLLHKKIKGTDFRLVSQAHLDNVQYQINERPRKKFITVR